MRYQASSTKAVHSVWITYDISIPTYWLKNTHCLTVLSQETTVHRVSAVLWQETQQYCHTSECVTLQEVQCHFLLPVQSIVTYSYSRLIQGTHQRVICHEPLRVHTKHECNMYVHYTIIKYYQSSRYRLILLEDW